MLAKITKILTKVQYVVYICIVTVIIRNIVKKVHTDMDSIGNNNNSHLEDMAENMERVQVR